MLELKIEHVADTLIKQAELFNCTLAVAWNEYTHPLITEQFSLEEVLNYIEDMEIYKKLEERYKNDDGTRYSFDDARKVIDKKLNR